MRKDKLFVVIGRFQPMHNGHAELLQKVTSDMTQYDSILVLLGSANKTRRFENPYPWYDRANVIKEYLVQELGTNYRRTYTMPLNDFDYADALWEDNLHNLLKKEFYDYDEIVFCSGKKGGDDELRASWARGYETRGYDIESKLSATDVRACLRNDVPVHNMVPKCSMEMISNSPEVVKFLKDTYNSAKNYIDSFSGPFPTQFAATDIIVRDRMGRHLAVRRGSGVGSGDIAWPGGHLEINLTSWDNAKKELLEETNLNIDEVSYNIITSWNCTEPGRSLLRRMTTEVFLVDIDESFDNLDIKIPEDEEVTEILFLKEDEVHATSWFSDHYGLFLRVTKIENDLLRLAEGKYA